MPQSALEVRGPGAGAIADLWWPMLAAGTVIFLLVAGILFYLLVRRGRPQDVSVTVNAAKRWIVMGGIVLPAVVLTPLFIASVRTLSPMMHGAGDDLTIHVKGHQWWWEIRYATPTGAVVGANEIHIPVGRRVRLELTTADVIHSLWIPSLHGKTDLVPGRTNVTWVEANEPGILRAQCAEYCGTQHALMALPVVAESQRDFDAWLAREGLSVPAQSGAGVFMSAGCGTCHTIRGTNAGGTRGPDLTHFGSRRTLAAGALPNNRENLTRWLSDPQAVKPGNKMPRVPLGSEQLSTIVTYLGTLR